MRKLFIYLILFLMVGFFNQSKAFDDKTARNFMGLYEVKQGVLAHDRGWFGKNREGFGPDYKLPGLSHRTGHGIGMEGHESVNFVHGEQEKLRAGMCFSNEPGIYIPGEFGVRLEDCIYMTDKGPQWFTVPPDSLDSPLGKVATFT